jgi:hypothetical protein
MRLEEFARRAPMESGLCTLGPGPKSFVSKILRKMRGGGGTHMTAKHHRRGVPVSTPERQPDGRARWPR